VIPPVDVSEVHHLGREVADGALKAAVARNRRELLERALELVGVVRPDVPKRDERSGVENVPR
jgi:hypothetical protein